MIQWDLIHGKRVYQSTLMAFDDINITAESSNSSLENATYYVNHHNTRIMGTKSFKEAMAFFNKKKAFITGTL